MASQNEMLVKLGNLAYDSVLIAGGSIASRYATSQIFKDRPVNKLAFKSVALLALDIAISNAVIGTLKDKDIIPKTIIN